MWEVDPETKSKLLIIQKKDGNDRCCDCGAPSPQWASPKFGVFICLTCAGTHRGLGVHISFVRSITMDAFKVPEIVRMDMGGNDNWKRFFDGHEITKMEGRTFEDCTIGDRYSEGVGEEWKERLTAKVEGREYVPGPKKSTASVGPKPTSNTPVAKRQGISSSATPSRSSSPASSIGGTGPSSRKAQNETYFAKLGNENASRSANLPPSQGGKYAGFGSEPPTTARKADAGEALPGVDEFQKDPMAALTKGFGWFTTTVGKGAKTVNDSYIQPTAQKLAEADLATQARLKAAQVAQNIQTGTKTASESFNRFVEGDSNPKSTSSSRPRDTVDPDKKDFWDSFAAAGEERSSTTTKPSAIGTAAMRKGGYGATGGVKKKESWDEDKWEKF